MRKIDIKSAEEKRGSSYPAPYDEPVRGRSYKKLGDAAGLTQFGVNLVRLAPGAWSSQRHWHTKQDEFVMMLEGECVLVTDAGDEPVRAGDCFGFPAGARDGHHFQNRTDRDAVFLVVGTRVPGDAGEYSDIDMTFSDEGYKRKDGTPILARDVTQRR
jgi:uncharacterized cupin superfamily protein